MARAAGGIADAVAILWIALDTQRVFRRSRYRVSDEPPGRSGAVLRMDDVRQAFRILFRRPAFAATAILLIAVASGANGAVLSVVRGVMLKPLPYSDPDRLVAFWPGQFVSNEEIGYWRDHTASFAEIAAASPGWMMSLVASGYEPLKVTGERTSGNFFTALGVRAARGRTLLPGDARPGAPRVAVLTDALFTRHFNRDETVIGRTVVLDGEPHEIVGVMPPLFEFLRPDTDLWAPLPFDPAAPNHRATFSEAFARLKSGVTSDAATRELRDLAARMRSDLGKPQEWGQTLAVQSLKDSMTAELRTTLLILVGAVGFVLVLAAVNLATLALNRSMERAPEIAIRAAIGASRTGLVRQLLIEHATLAACGSALGLLLAWAALPIIVARIPPEIPRQGEIALDVTVFLTVLAVTIVLASAIAFGPILVMARPRMQFVLRQGQSTEPRGRVRALGVLIAAQIAVAVVLGIGAALMVRTVWNLQHVDPGFRADRVLTFRLQTTSAYRDFSKGLTYLEEVVERVRALPGVQTVGAIQHVPLSGYNWTATVHPVEKPPAPGAAVPRATWRFIGWDYFHAMTIPLKAGRFFTAADSTNAPPVVIVNEAFARREYGSAQAALGRRLRMSTGRGTADGEIVGVTGDVRYLSLDVEPGAEFYAPLAQTFMFPMAIVVRTSVPPEQLAPVIRRTAYAIDRTVPVAELQPLETLLADTLARPRLLSLLLTVFAGAGLLITMVGVYGVVAYRVRQREREFGIRMALGATPGRLSGLVLRHSAMFAIAGIGLALPAAWFLTRGMESVLFGIAARDPISFSVLPAVVMLVTLAAAWLPARRASRIDPVVSMRGE